MKKLLLIVLSLVLAIACNKDKNSSNTTWKAFSFNGVQYVSLQEAVDAATSQKSNGETSEIVMIADYKGAGAVVKKEFSDYICLNISGHRCELTTPLDFGTALSQLYGEGLFAGDIQSRNAFLNIYGKLNIIGNISISCGTPAGEVFMLDDACFNNDFQGSFQGNVTLDNAMLTIYSENGRFEINELNVKGVKGMFNVDAVMEESVNVTKANTSEGGHLGTGIAGSLTVASGEKPHVHNFVESEVHSGTCMTSRVVEYVCSDCGYMTYRQNENEFGPCPVESLVHIASHPATPIEGGEVEHWECPFCGKHYADAQGMVPLLGAATLLPTNYLGDDRLLRDLDDVFDWNTEFEYETKDGMAVAGIVLAVLGMLETLGLSIPGLVADDGPKWAEVNAKLDKIQESLDRIETKIDALAQKVDAVAYKNLIISRNEKFNFLKTKSVPVFQLIDKYLKGSDADKKEKIAAAILDWSGNQFGGTHIADLTQSLMQQYVKTGLDANVPTMFEAVANCSYLWEHNGYNFRYQAMAQDVMLNGISYLLAGNYISSVKEYNNEDLRKADLEQLKKDFTVYEAAVKAELERIKDRNDKYRRYNHLNLTFNREGKYYDFRNWFETHRDKCFPRNNYNNVAVNSCNDILKYFDLDKELCLTTALAKELYTHYNRNNTVKASIYTILRDSVGFSNIPSQFDPGVIFTNSTSGFNHENDDSARPYYRIFSWQSYRGSNNNDHFGIRTCLNNDCTEGGHNILYYCDINSHDSGKINKTGKKTKWEWCTLVKAAQQ